jgi:hypothetical protein
MTKSPQLQSVEWRDLVPLTPAEKAWELTVSLPWVLGSLWCYGHNWWRTGLGCSFYFFLTGLRQSHNAQHYALGLPRIIQDGVLFILSVLMLASMHAVQATHLHHHRHCLEADDGEGATARLCWWRALLCGPLFLSDCTLRHGGWLRRQSGAGLPRNCAPWYWSRRGLLCSQRRSRCAGTRRRC